ncbi:MAG TPA: sensor histidine kinase [Rhodobacteraceae bacterium]|jgi:tryptophan-rich sensory protein|nr:sensor histidine kinase [Paracoccaceae bacterium]
MQDNTQTGAGRRYLLLPLFILLVIGGGALIGATNTPGPWYDGLQKPGFTPPDWLFGPVWTGLYILIAIAGWRIWRAGDSTLKALWAAQMALNFLWSPIFFTAHMLGLALVVIVMLLAVIVAVAWRARRADRAVSWLFLPYLLWVSYAALLNAALVWLN